MQFGRGLQRFTNRDPSGRSGSGFPSPRQISYSHEDEPRSVITTWYAGPGDLVDCSDCWRSLRHLLANLSQRVSSISSVHISARRWHSSAHTVFDGKVLLHSGPVAPHRGGLHLAGGRGPHRDNAEGPCPVGWLGGPGPTRAGRIDPAHPLKRRRG
jgi:hypothetical protein